MLQTQNLRCYNGLNANINKQIGLSRKLTEQLTMSLSEGNK